jgi:glycosyltransferase involved in cell wall biosynthesis
MTNPFFSTIIPVHNRRELVVPAIESALEQTFAGQEIIVVDDGSTDGTADVVRHRFGEKVRLLSQPNAGPGPARNTGMRAAVGTYLAFLDSDDRWFPWTLKTYRQVAEQYQMPSFITGKHRIFRDEAALADVTEQPVRVEAFADYFASGEEWRWWGASSFVIRRDAFLAVGGFADSAMNAEDADLAMRLGVSPGFVHVTEPTTFAYREHAANVRSDLPKNVAGMRHQLASEQAGRYPGGDARRIERYRILGTSVRPLTLELLRSGHRQIAWEFFCQTLGWHVRLRRFRFLAAFPCLAMFVRKRQ